MVKKVLGPWKDSYRPEISPDEFIQIHVESMENGTGLVFFPELIFYGKEIMVHIKCSISYESYVVLLLENRKNAIS